MMNSLIGCYNIIPFDDKIVLIKENNVWSLPSGKLELGETLEQCAIREALEESGLNVVPDKLIGVYQIPELRGTNVINFAFISSIVDADLFVESDEIKLYTISQVQELISTNQLRDNIHATIIGDYYSGNSYPKEVIKTIGASYNLSE